MAITTQALERSFNYNGATLPDPMPNGTLEDVRDIYSATFPEIVSASIEGPETVGGKLVYKFRKAIGTKG